MSKPFLLLRTRECQWVVCMAQFMIWVSSGPSEWSSAYGGGEDAIVADRAEKIISDANACRWQWGTGEMFGDRISTSEEQMIGKVPDYELWKWSLSLLTELPLRKSLTLLEICWYFLSQTGKVASDTSCSCMQAFWESRTVPHWNEHFKIKFQLGTVRQGDWHELEASLGSRVPRQTTLQEWNFA